MQSLNSDGYAGISLGKHVCYFIVGFKEPSLKTAVQICESQDHYSVDFQACTSYLTTMVQKTPTAKQINVAVTATKVDGVKIKNQDGTDQCLPPAKYLAIIYKVLSPKQKEGLWQDCKKVKANGEDIMTATERWGQGTDPPPQIGQAP